MIAVNEPSQCLAGDESAGVPRWYVAYTYPRHEKSVADQLAHKSVEIFLPTIQKTSHWKDRRVTLELPLFAGYVFARIPANERVKVLSTPSVIRLLSCRGIPVPVEDGEIEAVRLCVSRGATLQPHRFMAVGDRVRVREGAFEGLEGVVVRYNNGCKLVISIGLIHQSVALEIDADSLEHVAPPCVRALGHEPRSILQVRLSGV